MSFRSPHEHGLKTDKAPLDTKSLTSLWGSAVNKMMPSASKYQDSITSTDTLLEKGREAGDDWGYDMKPFTREKRWTRFFSTRKWLWVHLAALIVYTAVTALTIDYMASRYENGPSLVWSPALGAVSFQRKYINWNVNVKTPYKGTSPAVDKQWDEWMKLISVRVTEEELDRMNQTSVQLGDGSGDYLATLDVYHHLHCLKMIRQFAHPEYYPETHSDQVSTADHIDHCVDALREAIMCNADVSFFTYSWQPTVPFPWAEMANERACVDWEKLSGWARGRAVDIFEPGMLVHPITGPSYPHGGVGSHHHNM